MRYIYKIQRRNDEMFSTGGAKPKFSKTGKVWTSKAYLKSHLTLVEEVGNSHIYNDCHIIEYVLNTANYYDVDRFDR